MRCVCCDCELSDLESTRRNAITNEFMDMCDSCIMVEPSDFLVLERDDLKTKEVLDEWDNSCPSFRP